MISLNLLPDVKKEFIKAQLERNFVVFICIIVAVSSVGLLLILGGVMGAQQIDKGIKQGNINRDKATIMNIKKNGQLDSYLTVQNQLSQIESLKSKQPIFSRIFGYIQQLNPSAPNNVVLNSMQIASADDSSSIELGAHITLSGQVDSFEALDTYKTTLGQAQIEYYKGSSDSSKDVQKNNTVKEKMFKDVILKEATITDRQERSDSGENSSVKVVGFTLDLIYNEAIFSWDSQDIKVSVPNSMTSDGDRNAPKMFNGSARKSDANSRNRGTVND